jgi:bifunctional enzyme CysN/CysC
MSAAPSPAAARHREAETAGGHPTFQSIPELDGIVHMLTCGSVDDGKSTLIGRLLWDADDLTDDQRQSLARSVDADGIPDFSLLVDGLLAEREQGITIDIAWRYVEAGRRRLVIIDSPGHEQYTRNMASGASQADVAVMLVDARHGVKPQTRRHAAILDLVGVRHVVLAVNKMDLVDFRESRFRQIERDFETLAKTFGFHDARAIPVSAKRGDNVARRSPVMAWYRGPTLLERLSAVPPRTQQSGGPFRFPVQTVLRTDDFRGLAGTVACGRITVGDTIEDATSSRRAVVSRIVTMDGDLPRAESGHAVTLVLDTDIDVSRGAVLGTPGHTSRLAQRVDARLLWVADAPLEPGQRLLLRTAADPVPVHSLRIEARLDLDTLEQTPGAACTTNDLVIADIVLARPSPLDAFSDIPAMGAFVLVDVLTGATVAGGVVRAIAAVETGARERGFRLTRDMLAADLCRDLAPDDPEFQRRVDAVVRLFEAAGLDVGPDRTLHRQG